MNYAATCVENLCKWLGSHRGPACMGCISIANFQREERDRAAKIVERGWKDGGVCAVTEVVRKIREG